MTNLKSAACSQKAAERGALCKPRQKKVSEVEKSFRHLFVLGRETKYAFSNFWKWLLVLVIKQDDLHALAKEGVSV